MGKTAIFEPARDGKPAAYIEKIRAAEQRKIDKAERERAAKERAEIKEAMRKKAEERDPAFAGANLAEIERRGGVVIDRDKSGQLQRIQREPRHVFYQLGKIRAGQEEATLNQDMVLAAETLMDVYATKMGLAGDMRGEENDKVDKSGVHIGFINTGMHRAIKRWQRLMFEFGPRSRYPRLFELLCQDAMEIEALVSVGSRSCGKSRWRSIVSEVMDETQEDAQGRIVRQACIELVAILTAVEGGVSAKRLE